MNFLAMYQRIVKQYNHNLSPKVVVALQKLDLNTHDGKDHDAKTVSIAKDARKALDYYHEQLEKEVLKYPQNSKEEKEAHLLGLAVKKLDVEVKKVEVSASAKVADASDNPVILKTAFLGQYQGLVRSCKAPLDSELVQIFTNIDANKNPKKTGELCKKAKSRLDSEMNQARSLQAKSKDSKARGELVKLEAGLKSLQNDVKAHDAKNAQVNKHIL
jgi:hypothetical protein